MPPSRPGRREDRGANGRSGAVGWRGSAGPDAPGQELHYRPHRGRLAKVTMNEQPHLAARRRRRDIETSESGIGIAKEVWQERESDAGSRGGGLVLQIVGPQHDVAPRGKAL